MKLSFPSILALLSAAAVLVGEGLPHLLAHSTEKVITKKSAKILSRHGITTEELCHMLAAQFEHDPLQYAKHADARKRHRVLAAFDQVVPFKKGTELRKAFGCPPTIVISTGHDSSVRLLAYLQGKATAFFGRELRVPKFAGTGGKPTEAAGQRNAKLTGRGMF